MSEAQTPPQQANETTPTRTRRVRAIRAIAQLPKVERLAFLRRVGIVDAKGNLRPPYLTRQSQH